MKYPHDPDCRCGEELLPIVKGHDWWINAPDYGNCFWTYLRYNDNPHTLADIAKKMKLSISAITATERKALSKLRREIGKLD